MNSYYGIIFWSPVFFYLLYSRRGAKGWFGALIGVAFALVICFATGYLGARAGGNYLDNEFLSAINAFDPEAGAQMRGLTDEKTRLAILQPVLLRAVRKAPDDALVKFYAAQVKLVAPTSDNDVAKCAAGARGSRPAFDSISKEARTTYLHAIETMIRAAANNTVTPSVPTAEEVQPLLRQIYSRADPSGYMDDPGKFSKLPDKDLCRLFLAVGRETIALPPANAARVIRYNMVGQESRAGA